MGKVDVNERDIMTLHFAKRVSEDSEIDGIYAQSGAQASQYRKLVRMGLIEFTCMGETDDERPVALYNITNAGKALLAQRAKRKAGR